MAWNQTRREFVKTSARAGGALGVLGAFGSAACAGSEGGPLRILILGGTRFIGPHQVKYALDRGHEVSIFTRGQTEPPFYQDYFERVEHLIGDRTSDLSALEGREWDAVIDNSASYPSWVASTTELLRGQVDRYLFVSSISAYADFARVGIDEDYHVGQLSPDEAEDDGGYGPRKARCEQYARDAFGENAINVRPGLIIGPGDNTDRWTYWPVRVDRGGEVLAPNTPADPVQNVDARDLSEWIVRLVETPGNGGTYNATGEIQQFGDMLEEIRGALASDATFTWVPTEFMAEQEVAPWMHMTNWTPPEGETVGMNQVSVAAAVQAGLTFRPLADTARDTVEWWNSLPEDRRAEPRAGLPADKEAEVLAAWHADPG
ncbi:NAD-dependent epimerase/dehydratase family protein [Candidatus Palauibacter soopunensis]|uniref:NAD-dependent epimerase/dehydratase family protein n=1 Tax=Candidatus Palauibacter soopunensis TaxID=3056739 RepID=UPI0028734B5D|nr:NAD-dependent epimerase/dehydratase family protein [Candidatus Palauibacter soopunensis]